NANKLLSLQYHYKTDHDFINDVLREYKAFMFDSFLEELTDSLILSQKVVIKPRIDQFPREYILNKRIDYDSEKKVLYNILDSFFPKIMNNLQHKLEKQLQKFIENQKKFLQSIINELNEWYTTK